MIKYVMPKMNMRESKLHRMMLGVALCTALVMSGCVIKTHGEGGDKGAVVESLAASLEENFVFPEIGERYARYLRNTPLQNIDEMSPEQFSSALTSGLQSIHKDAHLRIMPPSDMPEQAQEDEKPASLLAAPSIEAAMWLMPSVAYIRFSLFPSDAKTLQDLDVFIKTHGNAKSLIIDVRGHRGGKLSEMDVMFAHMFSEATDLAYMETRQAVDDAGASPIKDGATVVTIKSPKGVVRRKHMAIPHAAPLMLETDIYILTSGYTASAAEHLSMVMKRTKRGLVVGEPTRGGAHYGGTIDLGGGYTAFVPVGRTFNPDTQKDWEGVGVLPNIQTNSDKALIAALLNMGVDSEVALAIDRQLNYSPPTPPK